MVKVKRTLIVVKSRFEAIHCWPDCPYEDVAFLRNPHRHEFHVTLKCEVSHDDRELEFIQSKRILEQILKEFFHQRDLGSLSCEMVAHKIYRFIPFREYIREIHVYEDGENGAELYY